MIFILVGGYLNTAACCKTNDSSVPTFILGFFCYTYRDLVELFVQLLSPAPQLLEFLVQMNCIVELVVVEFMDLLSPSLS